MTCCPICGGAPCINPHFCAACRDADRHKARGKLYAPLRPAPPKFKLSKVHLENGNWNQVAAEAWDAPSWKQAALEYQHGRGNNVLVVEISPQVLAGSRQLMSDNASLERASDEVSRLARERYTEAPEATYKAVVYELRTHGLPQFSNSNCQRRLSELSAAQIKAAMASLQARRKRYPNVGDELLKALARIYTEEVHSNV